jgi:hypothetical protein
MIKKNKFPVSYIAKILDGEVIVLCDRQFQGVFNEHVSLPAKLKEIHDAVEVKIQGEEITVYRSTGRAYAWNLVSQAPLGPR